MPTKSKKQKPIDPEVVLQSYAQIEATINFFRLYHFLSALNYSKALTMVTAGAVRMPLEVLNSTAYGFARDDNFFVVQFFGKFFDLIKQAPPTHAYKVDDPQHKGVIMMLTPVEYGNYFMPPVKLFFPIAAPKVFDRMMTHSKYLSVAKLELGLVKQNSYYVKEVINPPAIFMDLDEINEREAQLDNLMGMFRKK